VFFFLPVLNPISPANPFFLTFGLTIRALLMMPMACVLNYLYSDEIVRNCDVEFYQQEAKSSGQSHFREKTVDVDRMYSVGS